MPSALRGEHQIEVTTDAIGVHRGYGYMRDYLVEKLSPAGGDSSRGRV